MGSFCVNVNRLPGKYLVDEVGGMREREAGRERERGGREVGRERERGEREGGGAGIGRGRREEGGERERERERVPGHSW